jgi:hypothetical protein
LISQWLIVGVPKVLNISAPEIEILSQRMQLVRVGEVLELYIPPPEEAAELLVSVQLVKVNATL